VGWVRAGAAADFPAGQGRAVSIEGRDVAVFNVNGTFYAMDNVCPHRGAPLSDGRLEGGIVTCPWHGWEFDVRTGGLRMDPSRCSKTFPLERRGDDLFLSIEGAV
jgi:nitrite reductase/ring-hydroxylating ferredoxin subunit